MVGTTASDRMKYRPEIDGLRAVAVLPVILFHAGFKAFGGGFVGVDVFFVISGYLITGIIVAELARGRFSLIEFYERRARRILPALIVVVVSCIPFAWFLLTPSDLKDFWQSLVAVSLFSSNILFWLESDYFGADAELKPLLHTWSLAVEEQFYVFFPLLLLLLWPLRAKRAALVLAALSAVSFALAHWATLTYREASFYLLPTRGWELAIGALAALRATYAADVRWLTVPLKEILGAAGLILIAAAVFLFDQSTPFPSIYTAVPTVGTALVLCYGTAGTRVARFLSARVIVGIGLISYSAYLWHQPAFAFARHASVGEPAWWVYLLLSALSLALAYLTWRYVEQPFRKKGAISRRNVFALATACSSCVLAVGLWGSVGAGLEGRPMSEVQRRVLATAKSSPMRKQCHTAGADYRKPQYACEIRSGATQWAVFGDSHAVELAYALAQALEQSGDDAGVRQFSFSGCAPTYRRTSSDRDCSQWTDEAVAFVAADARITKVVVSYRMNAHLFGTHERVYPRQPANGDEAGHRAIWDSYVGILERLLSAGKQVTLVLQAPELPRPVASLVRGQRRPARVEGVDVAWWNARSAYVRERLHAIPSGVTVVDPSDIFCDERACLAVREGTALYYDDHHMSVDGARLVAEEVLRRRGSASTQTHR